MLIIWIICVVIVFISSYFEPLKHIELEIILNMIFWKVTKKNLLKIERYTDKGRKLKSDIHTLNG